MTIAEDRDNTAQRRRRGRGTRQFGFAAAVLVAIGCAAAPAAAAPALGRWEARGSGGARLVFMVVGAGSHRYVAHLAAFCGNHGAPELDNWTGYRGRPIVDEGDVVKLDGSGRFRTDFRDQPTLTGRLHDRSGGVHGYPRVLLGSLGMRCSASAYANLRARHAGPAPVPDGLWNLSVFNVTTGDLETGELRTYGGGSLVQWYGTFPGKPSPKYPTAPCEPVVDHAAAPIRGSGLRATYADSFGATTSVSLRGAFTATHAAGLYTSAFQYYDLVCFGAGVWTAGPVRRPVYRLAPVRPGGKAPGHVRFPIRTPRKGPRSGPEPDTFHCDYGVPELPNRPNRPEKECRLYTRHENGTTRLFWLHWGHTRKRKPFGYRHIAERRGFSWKTDRYIAQTLANGRWRSDVGGFERAYRGRGRSCTYRVVIERRPDGRDAITTAYRVEGGKQGSKKPGSVSGCP